MLILVAFLLGAPVFVAMAGIAMVLFFAEGTPIAAVPTETFSLVASATLPAIPLLTLAGYVLSEGGSAKRLVGAYQSAVRLDAGRPGHHGGVRLRHLHHLHRGLGGDHPRAGRAGVAGAARARATRRASRSGW